MTIWILVIVGYLAVTGYRSEADCKMAAKAFYASTVYCIPASEDARVSGATP